LGYDLQISSLKWRRMRLGLFVVLLLMLGIPAAQARDDIMPPPKPAPRMPVEAQELESSFKYKKDSKDFRDARDFRSAKALGAAVAAPSQEFEGKAEALDGERLLMDGVEIRLFGIITPALNSNFGPQARLSLDHMLEGRNVLCKTTDRDREGNPLAFCGTVKVPDLSYEMLRQGWAMVDRRALKGNALSQVYEKAEIEAQTKNRGIFSSSPTALTVPLSNPEKSFTGVVAAKPAEPAPEPAPAPAAKVEPPAPAPVQPVPVSAFEPSLIERFQTLVGAFMFLIAAGVFAYSLLARENKIIVDRRRALAAALRGELMAARVICRTRAKELIQMQDTSDLEPTRPSQVWPRVRSLVYQAHVSQLGILGAELARQVASIYGQFAEYASYYQNNARAAARLPVTRVVADTLNTLAEHVDTLLHGLMEVESTGRALMGEDIMAEEERRAAAENVRLATAAAAKRALPSPPPSTAGPATAALVRQHVARQAGRVAAATAAQATQKPPQDQAEADEDEEGPHGRSSSHVA
jgi:endonuclease YncB( thermonuclease family)